MPDHSPANTEYAHKVKSTLKSVFKGLPPTITYTSLFKKYSEYIMNRRAAIYQATQLLPILAALIVIMVERDLDHVKQLADVRNEYDGRIKKLNEEMEQLRREIKRLPSHD